MIQPGEIYMADFGPAGFLELFEFNGGHQFPETARQAAYAFLKKYLM
jgi:hypothetical protein